MFLACLIAVASVFVGAALGLSKRAGPDVLGPVRTFAFAAAAAVVVAVFVPESMETLGALALLPLAAGFFAPLGLERLTSRSKRHVRGKGAALEIGFVGLVVHQIGDGLGMGSFTGPLHDDHSHVDIFLAVGGHTVPIAALVVLAFAEQKGRAVALRRAFGLALSVVAGVVVARMTGVSLESSTWGGVLSGVVGGLLLHIATHDMGDALPRTHAGRAIDLAAAAAGVLVVVAGGHGHEHGAHAAHAAEQGGHGLVEALLAIAPFLLGAMIVAATGDPRRDRGPLDARGIAAGALVLVPLGASAAAPLVAALVAVALVWPSAASKSKGHAAATARLEAAGRVGIFAALGVAAAAFAAEAFAASDRTLVADLAATALLAGVAAVHPVAAAAPASVLLRIGLPSPFVVGSVLGGVAARGGIDRLRARRGDATRARVSALRATVAAALAIGAIALAVVLRDTPTAIAVPEVAGWIAAAASAAIVLVAAYLTGTRGLFAGLVGASSSAGHCHDADWGHVHWDHAHAHAKSAP